MKVKKELKPLWQGFLRLVIYGLAVLLLAEFMLWEAAATVGEVKFTEASYLEYAQALFLLVSCIILGLIYKRYPHYRYMAALMFGFLGASFIREQDVYFERYLGYGTWQIPVYLLLALVLYNVIKNFNTFLRQLEKYLSTASFGLFLMGMLTTYVFSRLFGRTKFWEAVMEEQYFRSVKNTAEECLELYGYMVLLIGVIELFLLAKRESRAKPL